MTATELDLDMSIANLLVLADRIERGEPIAIRQPAPVPPTLDAVDEAVPEEDATDETDHVIVAATDDGDGVDLDEDAAVADAAVRMQPAEMQPVEMQPVEPEPVEMQPVEMEPVGMQPVEMEPVGMQPVELEPMEMEPVEPVGSAVPVEPIPVAPPYLEPVHVVPQPVAATTVDDAPAGPAPDALARLEALREEISTLSAKRLGLRGRRRLDEAREEERAILRELGYSSYLELMLAGAGVQPDVPSPSAPAAPAVVPSAVSPLPAPVLSPPPAFDSSRSDGSGGADGTDVALPDADAVDSADGGAAQGEAAGVEPARLAANGGGGGGGGGAPATLAAWFPPVVDSAPEPRSVASVGVDG